MTKCEAAAAAGLTANQTPQPIPKAAASTKPVIVRIALMPMCAASDPSAAMRTNASHTASGDGRRTGAIPPEVRGEPPGGKKRRRDDKAQ